MAQAAPGGQADVPDPARRLRRRLRHRRDGVGARIGVGHLRDHGAVVEQHPGGGHETLPVVCADEQRRKARAVHEQAAGQRLAAVER